MRITQLRQADLNLLVVFTVLAEERKRLPRCRPAFLSQPAVSRALQRLRDMFHDDLLVRTAAGFEPTLQGQRLIDELEVMLPRLDSLLSGSRFNPEMEQARFRIAATDTVTSIVAPALCREVLPSAKKVFLEFVGLRNSGFEDLMRGGLDLVLSPDDTYPPSELQGEVIYEEELVCVVAAKSASSDHVAFDLAESQLNLVEPRALCRGEVHLSSATGAVTGLSVSRITPS
jgi:DNA-binding transcriptional LysR family regulator